MKAIVLAAGQGTRMRSQLPKVAHLAAGLPLVGWVLRAVAGAGPDRTVVVLGHESDQVHSMLPEGIEHTVQEYQLGTGHAVQLALDHLGSLPSDDTVLVVYGDMPTMTADLLGRVVGARETGVAAAMVTAEPDDPMGFGRVLRGIGGSLAAIVEESDASSDQLAISEVNCGIYAFGAEDLGASLSKVAAHNVQGEVYLTDVIGILVAEGMRVVAVSAPPESVVGVNSPDHLAMAEGILRRRINQAWMARGVKMQDPGRAYLDADVELAPGVRLYPGVHLEGATKVGAGAVIGPETYLLDTEVGEGAHVWYSVARRSSIGPAAEVGPYASLRPGTVLERGAKAGTFVEMKNTRVGEGAKVPHLAYMGDATIGAGANVGAGSITCNYDGYRKYETVIGEGAFIGSDTMLVAPVTVGERAVTGAGSVITRDVEPGALAVERSQQRNVSGYAAKRAKRAEKEPEH